jgi:hypothetical protein
MFGVVVFFFLFIAVPLLIKINSIRHTYWDKIIQHMNMNRKSFKQNILARIVEVHEEEADSRLLGKPSEKHASAMEYKLHPLMVKSSILLAILFLLSAVFIAIIVIWGTVAA